jgi:beta-N-acetylhexosaminidase
MVVNFIHPNIRLYLILFFLIAFTAHLSAQTEISVIQTEDEWVDSVYNSLSMEDRIAQLIFVRANYSGQPYIKSLDTIISKYNIGGVVFFKGEPVSQVMQTNSWNSLARTPLFIAIDAEWGLGMRLNNTVKYPLQMSLGAIKDNKLLQVMGKQIGDQCNRMGIHINFAPVVDVNSNPDNPVIGMRSFGQNPEIVSEKAYYYMKGMQSKGIIACAKHFPGHGNTFRDSHEELPVVTGSMDELLVNDLYPFKYLIDSGVKSIMTAHLSVPSMDNRKKLPSTLSDKIVNDYLINNMGFDGLVITDGLDMKGVTKYYKEGIVALKALEAGNDILLIPDNIPLSIQNILDAVSKGKVSNERIEKSCRKVLKYKYNSGLWDLRPIDTTNLLSDLNKEIYHKTSERLMQDAITVVKNDLEMIPLVKKTGKKALVVVGTHNYTDIEKSLSKYGEIEIFHLDHNANKKTRKKLINELKIFDIVIAAILNTNILASRNYGISKHDVDFVNKLSFETNLVLDIFASPYSLNFFKTKNIPTIVISYQEKPSAQIASLKIIMHGGSKVGMLPVDADGFKAGWGLDNYDITLYNDNPEFVGADANILRKIDSVAVNGIKIGAYPGCQIFAAKDGAIFYNKSFGYHTYDSIKRVKWNDLYDLASLTKILATTPALMKMTEDSLIDINGLLSDYLLMVDQNTNKDSLTFIEVLSHQSGLQNWIPFYESTITENGWDSVIYQSDISEIFPVRVANEMYIRKGYHHIIFDTILNSSLQDKSYHYSGLGFYLFKQMIENINNASFDEYIYSSFFNELNLRYLKFNPRNYFDLSNIIPTENDTIFRMQLLHGDVHDQGAAMLGGVSGNAGLFGNAYNVAVVMQMFMNGGVYDSKRYLEKETLELFNNRYFAADSNRRGLGFDKPLLKYKEHGTNCKAASPSSFGHSGFTGTYVWADPENRLVYVFLSNRVYPNMSNSKLMDYDIRTNIHQLFYEALKNDN